jgi:two-component system invasion response regulator UvrY
MSKILLVDDHALVRAGTKLLLEAIEGLTVIGEASCGEEAVQLARDLTPDIVLMDVNMPGIGGMEATMRLLRNDPSIKILIISTQKDNFLPSRLINLGAAGYLTKHANSEELLRAIESLQEGKRYIDPALLDHILLPRFSPQKVSPFSALSERELQILLMVGRGIEIEDIAVKLFLSSKTINGYRNNILKKLGIKTDVEATRVAIKYGLIDADNLWH